MKKIIAIVLVVVVAAVAVLLSQATRVAQKLLPTKVHSKTSQQLSMKLTQLSS